MVHWKRGLVTAGAGFIGSHITEKLLESNKEVVVYDNLSVGRRANIPATAEFVKGDIRDKMTLERAMQGIDVVFHNAAFVSIRGSFKKVRDDLENNCLGTLTVLEAAVSAGVSKLIFASSMAVYGDTQISPMSEDLPVSPISPYGYSKMMGEFYCKMFEEHYGLKTVCLRYFNTYGVRQTPSDYVGVTISFINNVLQNKAMTVFGDGHQVRDFVWVEDVAQANCLAAQLDISKETINIGSGTETSINELAGMIQSHLGGQICHADSVPGEIRRIVAHLEKAQTLLGYRPKGIFSEQLPKLIERWRHEA